ncbi:MAG: Cd(II)/Pb(II)-responsive transcriptional regulator [Gammaproteobacteria bacterium]|nr:Cd(II)/Pb(II)-responsive transcriptional regulator [Gammaproteobacteria bacterium]MBU0786601.1 Cd(II)/Pb(II)-responsive transcriptional regulator [Gammaproteobacteria bacterium]MBU0814328.1 Cd(II)/Pb(II)-responsive transcriptional regulator [Gammaproteobacteria bacterium]MBU1786152.1 Cd(II)/Pb(II)-responsive transcriptional regulator [Gammaproteobacteria bacterium]
MKIGELAKTAQTQSETIRYYEREGLLPKAERNTANYRVYSECHIQRLAFIRHCRSLDMTLGEIRTLLHFKDAPEENCAEVNDLLDEHIGHVATRIRELKALEKELKSLREQCVSGQAAGCGILIGLQRAAQTTGRVSSKGGHRGHVHGTHQQIGTR